MLRTLLLLMYCLYFGLQINFLNGQNMRACVFKNSYARKLQFDYSKAGAAVELAADYVVNDSVLPAGVNLELFSIELGPECPDQSHAQDYVLDLWSRGFICNIYIGPGCTADVENVYDISDFLRIPMIGLSGAGVGAGTSLAFYPSLIRMSVTHTNTLSVLLRFFAYFNYTNIAVIVDRSDRFYTDMFNVIQGTIYRQTDSRFYLSTLFRQFNSRRTNAKESIRMIFKEIEQSARVVCLLANGTTTRKLMVRAAKYNMISSDYVYLAVELFQSATWGSFSWQVYDDDDNAARTAYSSLLLVSYKQSISAVQEQFERKIKEKSPKYGYIYAAREKVETVVAHFYDAIVLYASLLSSLVKMGAKVTDNEALWKIANNYSFTSPLSGLVQLDNNGDRLNDYAIKKFSDTSSRFEPFLELPFATRTVQIVDKITWKDGMSFLPPNTPRCGFRGDNPDCIVRKDSGWDARTIVTIVLIPLLIVIFGCATARFVLTRYFKGTFDPYWWRILEQELREPSIDGMGITAVQSRSHHSASGLSAARFTTTSSKDKSSKLKDTISAVKSTFTIGSLYPTCNQIFVYKTNLVGATVLPVPLKRANMEIAQAMLPLRLIQHVNLQEFYGIEVSNENLCLSHIGELCPKGNLAVLLKSSTVKLDEVFKISLVQNLVTGLSYLHKSVVASHGFLSETTCLIDSRFVLKITGYGLSVFRTEAQLHPPASNADIKIFYDYLWRAPEFLRKPMGPKGRQPGDVYSVAILMHQIILEKPPFGNPAHEEDPWIVEDEGKIKDIIMEVKRGSPPLRPRLVRNVGPDFLWDLMEQCWMENPASRPTIHKVQETIKHRAPQPGDRVTDHLIQRMEGYATTLEEEVEHKTRQFMEEKRRGEEILSRMLPKYVARAITDGMHIEPETFDSTTVFFSHLEGFEQIISRASNPLDITTILNNFYVICDAVIDKYDVYKVEVVTDAYMVVSGLPVPNGIEHASIIAKMALELTRKISGRAFDGSPDGTSVDCDLRIGMNSGSCVAGIIGIKLPRYCLFGDTVNIASRMESNGQAGKIHASTTTQELLKNNTDFSFTCRGEITIKGKGMMTTYWLHGKQQQPH
ncbi:atrial natriuretic peptide receptor 2-like [Paramacrobiotus metropolitanus]|uniref:atrial natriuretic peptide receptor 2-like n=1 Tax=Paramacrobiotus metropolitanus TaxID=2943436 RepID=UPI0024465AF9|nr:atrial natriuretic peptide receptor 2-like [Paramacrobiotus metropolitanus]